MREMVYVHGHGIYATQLRELNTYARTVHVHGCAPRNPSRTRPLAHIWQRTARACINDSCPAIRLSDSGPAIRVTRATTLVLLYTSPCNDSYPHLPQPVFFLSSAQYQSKEAPGQGLWSSLRIMSCSCACLVIVSLRLTVRWLFACAVRFLRACAVSFLANVCVLASACARVRAVLVRAAVCIRACQRARVSEFACVLTTRNDSNRA